MSGFGGGSLSFMVKYDTLNFSNAWAQGLKNLISGLVQSADNLVMPDLEANTNNYLNSLIAEGGPRAAAAEGEYDYLNNAPNVGYNTISSNLTAFLNDITTGSANAAVPPQIDVLNGPLGPTLAMPGFPASAVKDVNFTPYLSLGFSYPYISPAGQWQPPKLGDLLASVGISGTAPISDDTLVPISGNWTGSLRAALSPGHNFQLQDGNYSASIGFDVDLFNNKNVQLEMQATGTFNPDGGSVANDLSGQTVVGFAVSW